MELDRIQRLILLNQFEILNRLDPKSGDYGHYMEVLRRGYAVFYHEFLDSVDEVEMSEDDGDFVFEILEFYRTIENYKLRNPGDADIERHPWGTFPGFDGNHEAKFMALARFMINDGGLYQEQLQYSNKNDNFNSNARVIPKYMSMLEKWKQRGREPEPNKDYILDILNAEDR